MFNVIKEKTPKDAQYPDRYYNLMLFRRILDGTLYECFDKGYHNEYTGPTGFEKYVPESERAPNITTGLNMLRSVVEESVSFLFGENRFPEIIAEDPQIKEFIEKVVLDAHLVHVMQEASIKGSTGSVAVQVRVLNDRFFLTVHYTEYLTPEFDPQAPDTLIRLTEKRKVSGKDLANFGYDIDPIDQKKNFWFQRQWDADTEYWYVPWEVIPLNTFNSEEEKPPVIDRQRTVEHRLGMVPFVWIKNLPNGPNDIDGAATFEPAIENAVQIDYALSRADRALKYNADPLFVFKTRNPNGITDFVRGSDNALVLGIEGDAKVLEISGDAAHAIIDTVNELKDEALHSIHGNRADPDKLATSQSSVAQRMLYLPMVQLASQLRVSYGDAGIIPIMRMLLRIASKIPVKVRGDYISVKNPEEPLELEWADFFPPTPADMQTESATIVALYTNGLISHETALRQLGKFFDFAGEIEDEIARVDADNVKKTALLAEQSKAEALANPPRPPSSSK